jgi:hypothetical protein
MNFNSLSPLRQAIFPFCLPSLLNSAFIVARVMGRGKQAESAGNEFS